MNLYDTFYNFYDIITYRRMVVMSEDLKREIEGIKKFGYEFIINGRKEDWEKFCDAQSNSLSVEMARQVLEIMILISKGESYDYIYEYCNNRMSHSNNSWAWMLFQVAKYHSQGIDFANNCDDPLALMGLKEELVRLSKENEILKNNSSNTNTSKK